MTLAHRKAVETQFFGEHCLIEDVTQSIGGTGGGGGNGGTVSVNLYDEVSTEGDWANGVVAESIGGGGGASQGDSFGVAAPVKPGSSYVVGETLNLGGSGPNGGRNRPDQVTFSFSHSSRNSS